EAVKGDWVLRGRRQAGYAVARYDIRRELVIDPIIFSTYLGGNGNEFHFQVALDPSDNIYVFGATTSANYPVSAGAFQTVLKGGTDLTVTKINPTGSAVLYCTYLGGTGNENFTGGGRLAVDAGGNAYVTEISDSTDYPTTPGVY